MQERETSSVDIRKTFFSVYAIGYVALKYFDTNRWRKFLHRILRIENKISSYISLSLTMMLHGEYSPGGQDFCTSEKQEGIFMMAQRN